MSVNIHLFYKLVCVSRCSTSNCNYLRLCPYRLRNLLRLSPSLYVSLFFSLFFIIIIIFYLLWLTLRVRTGFSILFSFFPFFFFVISSSFVLLSASLLLFFLSFLFVGVLFTFFYKYVLYLFFQMHVKYRIGQMYIIFDWATLRYSTYYTNYDVLYVFKC